MRDIPGYLDSSFDGSDQGLPPDDPLLWDRSEAGYCRLAERAAEQTRYRPVRRPPSRGMRRPRRSYQLPAAFLIWAGAACVLSLALGVWLGATMALGTLR